MAKYDDIQNLYKMSSVCGNAISAGKASASIDCKGFEQAMLVVRTGTLASTNVCTVSIQHSDDDAVSDAYANITGAVITLADDDDDTTLYAKLRLNVATVKRYIRIHVINATAVGEYAAMLMVGNKSGEYPVDAKVLEFDVLNVA